MVKLGGWWRWALVSLDGVCPARWSVCLPLLVSSCTVKSRSSLLALAHPGGPSKKAVKRLWCGGGGQSDLTKGLHCHRTWMVQSY